MIESWTGCYDAGWKGLITDEAFAHPAKFSRNLIGRIYRHMIERGWLAPGMTVVDPFGGVALGALDAMANGLHWTGCELEPKFHALGNQNIAEWVRRYGHTAGWGSARLLNGDSRRLCDVVGGADCVVSSPPYATEQFGGGGEKHDKVIDAMKAGYGHSPGQLGSMKAGSVDSVVSSPPFADGTAGDDSVTIQSGGKLHGFPGKLRHSRGGNRAAPEAVKERQQRANLAHFSVGANGMPQETFWHAAREIVQQCHAILKPGGIAAWVVKSFVRNKKLVDFPGDWRRLCESLGFETVEEVRAMLTRQWQESTLFDGVVQREKKRASFFRRLAEKKGSPRIDWETVLFVRKSCVNASSAKRR